MKNPQLKIHPKEFSQFVFIVNNTLNMYANLVVDKFGHVHDYNRYFITFYALRLKLEKQRLSLLNRYVKDVKINLTHDEAFCLTSCTLCTSNNTIMENFSLNMIAQIDRHYNSVEGNILPHAIHHVTITSKQIQLDK
jgi:hypothetical protein